jgi:hypothetical protein
MSQSTPGPAAVPDQYLDRSYRYSPLPGRRHIRLLQLVDTKYSPASEGDFLSSARWRLVVMDLNDLKSPYVAISYVWGSDPNPENRVWFEEGGSLAVTDSAATILKEIIASGPDRYHWIDALCINQHDE